MCKYFVIVLVFCASLCSCVAKITCRDPHIWVTFKGYDTTSLSEIVFYKYEKNGANSFVLDSISTGTNQDEYRNEQADGFSFYRIRDKVNSNYDWEVYIKKEKRKYKIRGVNINLSTYTEVGIWDRIECYNDVSYYLNDSFYDHQSAIHVDDKLSVGFVYIMLIK